MTVTAILKTIMKSIKMKQSTLAEKVGAKSESVISSRMTMKNMGVNMLVEMLDCMGYELVARPVDGVEGAEYIITKE